MIERINDEILLNYKSDKSSAYTHQQCLESNQKPCVI